MPPFITVKTCNAEYPRVLVPPVNRTLEVSHLLHGPFYQVRFVFDHRPDKPLEFHPLAKHLLAIEVTRISLLEHIEKLLGQVRVVYRTSLYAI